MKRSLQAAAFLILAALVLSAAFALAAPGKREGAALFAEAPAPALAPAPTATPTSAPTPKPAPEPPPAPTPEPTPEPTLPERLLAGMSLEEKLCQLLVVRPGDIAGYHPVTEADGRVLEALTACPAGGLFLDADNMKSSAQLSALTEALSAAVSPPPLIVCDEEGGTVSRLMRTVGTTKLDSMYSYRDRGPEIAFSNAETIGRDLIAHGLNGDFAPVADVWSNPNNTVIRTRAYSDDFSEAAELVAAAVEGFHAGGVACTLKHFPGHGDTVTDSHYGKVYVTKTLEELREGELLPFVAGIGAGADMVMLGHITVTALDEVPAPFSHAVVTELLRDELGFTGVVISDAMQMQALGDYGSGEAAVLALQAGVDMLLCPGDTAAALAGLRDAVESGLLSEARIDESVLRILAMKEARGILGDPG